MFVPAPMNATSKPSILTDRPVLIPEPYFHSNVSLPPASAELAAFRDTECYCPVHLSEYPRLLLMSHMLIPSVLNETTYPITLICSGWLSSCMILTTRPPGDTENYHDLMVVLLPFNT